MKILISDADENSRVREIKARVDILKVVGTLVSLDKCNRGPCPICGSRINNLRVYLGEHPHFHCFGCGAHGDVIDFVRKTKGLSFTAALTYLEELAARHLQGKE